MATLKNVPIVDTYEVVISLLPLLSLIPSHLESVEIGEHLLLWINVKSKIYFTFETFAN